jgi:hypothetical protein
VEKKSSRSAFWQTERIHRLLFWSMVIAIFLGGTFAPGMQPPLEAAEKADLSTAIIQVAKQNIPSVAHIEVTERQEVANPFLPFEKDHFPGTFLELPRCPKNSKGN